MEVPHGVRVQELEILGMDRILEVTSGREFGAAARRACGDILRLAAHRVRKT